MQFASQPLIPYADVAGILDWTFLAMIAQLFGDECLAIW
jgi:hypothetical protein